MCCDSKMGLPCSVEGTQQVLHQRGTPDLLPAELRSGEPRSPSSGSTEMHVLPPKVETAMISEIEIIPMREDFIRKPNLPELLRNPSEEKYPFSRTTPSDLNPVPDISNLDSSTVLGIDLRDHNQPLSLSSWNPYFHYLQQLTVPVSIRTVSSLQVSFSTVSTKLHISLGPIYLQQWDTSSQQPYFRATEPTEGYGFSVAVTSILGKASFSLYFVRKIQQFCAPSISVQWNLGFLAVVQNNAKVMQLARMGNVAAMKKLFLQRKASPSDVMENGQGLLHVRHNTLYHAICVSESDLSRRQYRLRLNQATSS